MQVKNWNVEVTIRDFLVKTCKFASFKSWKKNKKLGNFLVWKAENLHQKKFRLRVSKVKKKKSTFETQISKVN